MSTSIEWDEMVMEPLCNMAHVPDVWVSMAGRADCAKFGTLRSGDDTDFRRSRQVQCIDADKTNLARLEGILNTNEKPPRSPTHGRKTRGGDPDARIGSFNGNQGSQHPFGPNEKSQPSVNASGGIFTRAWIACIPTRIAEHGWILTFVIGQDETAFRSHCWTSFQRPCSGGWKLEECLSVIASASSQFSGCSTMP